jgi:hypothetical protein
MTFRFGLIALFAAALICGGCSSSGTPGNAGSSTPPAGDGSVGPTLDITIANGSVTPTNAQLQAKVGQPITLRVSSDAADELHVHSVPDHTLTVEPRPDQTYQFTVDVPGRVEVELHHLGRTVATIQVQA